MGLKKLLYVLPREPVEHYSGPHTILGTGMEKEAHETTVCAFAELTMIVCPVGTAQWRKAELGVDAVDREPQSP